MNRARTIYLLFFLVFLLIGEGCTNGNRIQKGLWIGDDITLMFSKDSVYHDTYGNLKYNISENRFSFDSPSENFELEYDIIYQEMDTFTLRDIGHIVGFKKSKFENSFDQIASEFGLTIDLPKGYSSKRLNSKGRIEFLYAQKELKTLTQINRKYDADEVLDSIRSQVKSKNFISRYVLHLDKNLPFSEFKILMKPFKVLEVNSYLGLYVAVDNIPNCIFANCPPWQKVSYEYLLYNEFDSMKNSSDFIPVSMEQIRGAKIESNSRNNSLYNYCLKSYEKNPNKRLFKLIEDEYLTYGDYISLYSAINDIVYTKRDSFSKAEYGKSYEWVKLMDSDYRNNREYRDSIHRNIVNRYPLGLVVEVEK